MVVIVWMTHVIHNVLVLMDRVCSLPIITSHSSGTMTTSTTIATIATIAIAIR